MVGVNLVLVLLVSAGVMACDKKPSATSTPTDTASTAAASKTPEEPPRILSPAERAAYAKAKVEQWSAQRKAFDRASRMAVSAARQKERDSDGKITRPVIDGATHFTILFSSNNHGEREDCGCKRNPLGGLDRRATMVQLANDPKEPLTSKYWGPDQAKPTHTFLVDAGDMLYKSTSVRDGAPARKELEDKHAEAVIEAMNQFPPDVFNVGELDLAMGLGRLRELEKKAKFPFISANLVDAKSKKPIFPGHEVIERDGRKIAFIGIIKARPVIKGYYADRGVEVRDAITAYREQLEALPADVDLVVLLDNNGVGRTQTLLGELEGQKLRVDLALASNSNRLTRDPVWAGGTPILEPMSRGKYFGRVDIWKSEEGATRYSNDSPGDVAIAQDYKRLWGRYLQTRIGYYRAVERLATLEIEDASEAPDSEKKQDPKRKLMFEKQHDLYKQRLELSADEVVVVANHLSRDKGAKAAIGKDWIEASVMPVAIDVPQDKDVRRVLDKYVEGKK